MIHLIASLFLLSTLTVRAGWVSDGLPMEPASVDPAVFSNFMPRGIVYYDNSQIRLGFADAANTNHYVMLAAGEDSSWGIRFGDGSPGGIVDLWVGATGKLYINDYAAITADQVSGLTVGFAGQAEYANRAESANSADSTGYAASADTANSANLAQNAGYANEAGSVQSLSGRNLGELNNDVGYISSAELTGASVYYAAQAGHAESANGCNTANEATSAQSAGYANSAGYADSAGSANTAAYAESAGSVGYATEAGSVQSLSGHNLSELGNDVGFLDQSGVIEALNLGFSSHNVSELGNDAGYISDLSGVAHLASNNTWDAGTTNSFAHLNAAGSVGIGTNAPARKLQVAGSICAGNPVAARWEYDPATSLFQQNGQGVSPRMTIGAWSTHYLALGYSNTGSYGFTYLNSVNNTSNGFIALNQTGGEVGIGTGIVKPAATLEVAGSVLVRTNLSASSIKVAPVPGLTNGVWFGDGDSGFSEVSDGSMLITLNNVAKYGIGGTWLSAWTSLGFGLRSGEASSNYPNICPRYSQSLVGIGYGGSNTLSFFGGDSTPGVTISGGVLRAQSFIGDGSGLTGMGSHFLGTNSYLAVDAATTALLFIIRTPPLTNRLVLAPL